MTTALSPEEEWTDASSQSAFRLEHHGIDLIPASDRWARPRDLFGMWAGASVNFEYLVYGAVLMTFGVSFTQAVWLILLGNISYVVVGMCSLQGPKAGTTTFAINRASYGPNGSRLTALLNWATCVGFETEGLILVVLAAVALAAKAGYTAGTPLKVLFVVLAAGLQAVLPFLGHATVVKSLRALALPFVVLYAVMAGLSLHHVHSVHTSANWQGVSVALAFVIVLTGLGWNECGNDYSRYLPANSSPRSVVGWVFLGTAVPEALLMLLGAAVATYLPTVGDNPISQFPRSFPGWFLVPFLVVAIVQLFAINSLDLYSSGVTLQALGLRIKRWYAVLIDTVISCGLTAYAVFSSSFSHLLTDFADLVIVWLGPWTAVFLVDWAMRRGNYDPLHLTRTDRTSRYWYRGGVHWPAIVAQVLGSLAAVLSLNSSFSYAGWLSRLTSHGSCPIGPEHCGADFSVFSGLIVGGLVYLVLARRSVLRSATPPVVA
jgi:NCS1 family nucleobase:cation symporter-1